MIQGLDSPIIIASAYVVYGSSWFHCENQPRLYNNSSAVIKTSCKVLYKLSPLPRLECIVIIYNTVDYHYLSGIEFSICTGPMKMLFICQLHPPRIPPLFILNTTHIVSYWIGSPLSETIKTGCLIWTEDSIMFTTNYCNNAVHDS